jgi:hypothetical protein
VLVPILQQSKNSLLSRLVVLEVFRRTLTDGATLTHLDRLSNRLTKILAEAKRLICGSDRAEIGR